MPQRHKASMTALPDTDSTDGNIIEKCVFKTKHKPEVALLKIIVGQHVFPTKQMTK